MWLLISVTSVAKVAYTTCQITALLCKTNPIPAVFRSKSTIIRKNEPKKFILHSLSEEGQSQFKTKRRKFQEKILKKNVKHT
jgi:hypothetical protein